MNNNTGNTSLRKIVVTFTYLLRSRVIRLQDRRESWQRFFHNKRKQNTQDEKFCPWPSNNSGNKRGQNEEIRVVHKNTNYQRQLCSIYFIYTIGDTSKWTWNLANYLKCISWKYSRLIGSYRNWNNICTILVPLNTFDT